VDKLYNLVLNHRISKYLEDNDMLHDAQQGFRPDRSAVDNIFMLKTCLDARCQQKLDTYLLFADIDKAYDTVWRAGLLWHLWQKGVQGRMFRVLAQMLDHTPSVVMHRGTYSHVITPDMGWEQGDTLATTMFKVFIDSVLQHVWAEHAGVPIPTAAGAPAKLVALMYADDMVGFAADAPDMQALIDCTRAVLDKWQLRASVHPSDASKTAVLKVRGGPKSARISAAAQGVGLPGGFMWGDVAVPTVKTYKYLGVWVNETNTWDEHLRLRKLSAERAAGAHRKIMTQARLPVHLRKLTLTTVVQPVLTYAAQVWAQPGLRRTLDSWQMGLATRAFHCPSTTSHVCLQQEIGLCPLHIVCETLAVRYWHHLQRVPEGRLLHTVSRAWPAGKYNPWAAVMGKLLQQYDIDATAAVSYGKEAFHGYLAGKAMVYLKGFWTAPPRSYSLGVHARYTESFGVGMVQTRTTRMRKYLGKLTAVPGYKLCKGAELCMQMRLECLPLNAMHSHRRGSESAAAQQARERCPCCQQAPETPAHFLLECPAYTHLRSPIAGHIQDAQDSQDLDPWRALLAFTGGPPGPVASFVLAAWQRRRAVLTGREANGVSSSMALSPEPAVRNTVAA
jgi:Reverse transcriptase (RNA-dependent DNA polymerase)